MKKFLFILLLTIVCVGCERVGSRVNTQEQKVENAMYGWTVMDRGNKFRTITIDGHEYLFFVNYNFHSIAVVHSESCPCKNKKK